jgi:hypothetical protein
MGARFRGMAIAAVVASGVGLLLGVTAPLPASAAPFVEGEGLEWCGERLQASSLPGSLVLSGDGNTAVSGQCVFVRSGPTWTEQAELPLPLNRGTKYAMSADGNTLIAGGYPELKEDLIFVRSGETWVQQGTLPTGSVTLSGDGNTLLMGNTVFTRSGETWTPQATLGITPVQKKKKGEEELKQFGLPQALSADGNIALMGDRKANRGKGAVFVFKRTGEVWSQQAILTAAVKGKDVFPGGIKLSADGSTALITSPYEQGFRGAIRFFTRSGETWKQEGPKISPPGTHVQPHTFFGAGVALSGDGSTALVKSGDLEAENGKGEGLFIPEVVYVYDRTGETWTTTETLHSTNERPFGRGPDVQLSEGGDVAMILEGDAEKPLTTTWTR